MFKVIGVGKYEFRVFKSMCGVKIKRSLQTAS